MGSSGEGTPRKKEKIVELTFITDKQSWRSMTFVVRCPGPWGHCFRALILEKRSRHGPQNGVWRRRFAYVHELFKVRDVRQAKAEAPWEERPLLNKDHAKEVVVVWKGRH